MMKSTLLVSAILASIANAVEEHNFDLEETIIDGIDQFVPAGEKFYSYTSHLGKPAMHEELEDGKNLINLSQITSDYSIKSYLPDGLERHC